MFPRTQCIWFAIVQDGKKVQASPQDEALSPKFSCSIYSLSAISVLKVTIPLDALQAPEDDTTTLPVSLPLLLYTTGIVKSLDLLLGRILRARLLPQGIYKYNLTSLLKITSVVLFAFHVPTCGC